MLDILKAIILRKKIRDIIDQIKRVFEWLEEVKEEYGDLTLGEVLDRIKHDRPKK